MNEEETYLVTGRAVSSVDGCGNCQKAKLSWLMMDVENASGRD